MSFWSNWSDGKEWAMGIVSALVVAFIVSMAARVPKGRPTGTGTLTASLAAIQIVRTGVPFANPAFQCTAELSAIESDGSRLLADDAGRESSIATGTDASVEERNVWSDAWPVADLRNVQLVLRVAAREDNGKWLNELSSSFVLPKAARDKLLIGEPVRWQGSVPVGSNYRVTFAWILQLET